MHILYGTPYIAILGNKCENGMVEIEETKSGNKFEIKVEEIEEFLNIKNNFNNRSWYLWNILKN